MNAYCEKQGRSRNTVRFQFDDNTINGTQTPKDLGLENDDYIEAKLEQIGGK